MQNFVVFTNNASIFARSSQEKIFLEGKNKKTLKITDTGECEWSGKNLISAPFKRKGWRHPDGLISIFADPELEKQKYINSVIKTDEAIGYEVHSHFERDGKIFVVEFGQIEKPIHPFMLTIREKRGLIDDGLPSQVESDCEFSCMRLVHPKQVLVGRPEYTSRAEALFHLEIFLFSADDKEKILSSGFLDKIHTL